MWICWESSCGEEYGFDVAAELRFTSQYNARIRESSRNAGFDELLTAGADVNIVDEMGRPALTYAVMLQDKPQYVKRLVKAGANVNLADFRGISPLMFALIHRAAKNVNLLLKAGAVLYAENPSAFFDSMCGYLNIMKSIRAGPQNNTVIGGIFQQLLNKL